MNNVTRATSTNANRSRQLPRQAEWNPTRLAAPATNRHGNDPSKATGMTQANKSMGLQGRTEVSTAWAGRSSTTAKSRSKE